jgi:mRNA (guanine-N7-)-methyltransferase
LPNRLALEYGLKLDFHATFHELFEQARSEPQFAQLLERMKVVNSRGELEMTDEMWEASSKAPEKVAACSFM